MSLTLLSQTLSLLLAAAYLVTGCWTGGWQACLGILVCLSLPLACIWFPEELGDLGAIKGRPTSKSPASLVLFGGWILLLLPLAIAFRG